MTTGKMLKQISLNSKKVYMIGLGSEMDYQILEKNIEKYKKQKYFWLYDRVKLDLGYFLAHQQQKIHQVTYVTRQNFMTIQITEKSFDKQIKTNDKVMSMILNNEYRILSGNYEYHPFKQCQKICRYMNMIYGNWVNKLFSLTFSSHPIQIKGSFQPKMKELRQKYLNVNDLKLRDLQRNCNATPEEFKENMNLWKQRYQTREIQSQILHQGSSEQEETKRKWVEQNKFGWQVDASVVIQGYGKKFSSFTY